MVYNKKVFLVSSAILLAFASVGVYTSPERVNAESVKPKCDAFELKKDTLRKAVETKYANIKDARQSVSNSLAKESARSNNTLQKQQQTIDAAIKKSISGLHDKASTDEQHKAVDEYGKAATAAVAKYRQENISARAQFDQGIADTLESYRAEIDGTVEGLISSYESVIDEAMSVCYESTVKKGQEIIKPGIEEISIEYSDSIRNLNDQVAELNDARKEALAAATEAQDEELLIAKEALAEAFGDDSSKVISD